MIPSGLTRTFPAVEKPESPWAAYLMLIGAATAWGGSAVAVKVAVVSVPPGALSLLRYGLAAVLFVGLLVVRRSGWPRWRDLPYLTLAGVLGVVIWSWCYNAGLRLTAAGEGTVISGTSPIVTALVAAVVLGDRLTWRWFVAVLFSIAGVVVLVAGGPGLAAGGGDHLLGDLILFGAAIGWGSYSVMVRVLQRRGVGLIESSGYTAVIGFLLFVPIALVEPDRPASIPPEAAIAAVYLAIFSTVAAYLWWNEGVRRIGAPRAALFTNLTNVMSILFAVVLLGERFAPVQIVGAGLVLAGLIIANRR